MVLLCLAYIPYKLFIHTTMTTLITMFPRVVPGNAHFQDLRHLLHRPLVPIIIDKLEHLGYFSSREKMATTFFNISFVSFRSLFSLQSSKFFIPWYPFPRKGFTLSLVLFLCSASPAVDLPSPYP